LAVSSTAVFIDRLKDIIAYQRDYIDVLLLGERLRRLERQFGK